MTEPNLRRVFIAFVAALVIGAGVAGFAAPWYAAWVGSFGAMVALMPWENKR